MGGISELAEYCKCRPTIGKHWPALEVARTTTLTAGWDAGSLEVQCQLKICEKIRGPPDVHEVLMFVIFVIWVVFDYKPRKGADSSSRSGGEIEMDAPFQ